MVGSERAGRPEGKGRVVGVKLIEAVEGGHTVPVRPARERESEVLCAARLECRAMRCKEDSRTRKNHPRAWLDSSNQLGHTPVQVCRRFDSDRRRHPYE